MYKQFVNAHCTSVQVHTRCSAPAGSESLLQIHHDNMCTHELVQQRSSCEPMGVYLGATVYCMPIGLDVVGPAEGA